MVMVSGALSACAAAGSSAVPSIDLPSIDVARPALAMDAVECDGLVTEAEVEAIHKRDVTALGRSFSSCYWVRPGHSIQLVFNTGQTVATWRDSLLETYTRRIEVDGIEIWAKPGTDSVATFGPDRGLIVHGLPEEEAVALLLLALARL